MSSTRSLARHRTHPPRRVSLALTLVVLAAAAAPAAAQRPATDPPPANPADVQSIDAIITALYDVISGPAGERDWDRFRSLFLPDAILMNAAPSSSGAAPRARTPDEFAESAGRSFRANPFYEAETARVLERFGTVAHAFSTYESRRAPDAEPFARGINSIQLVRHDGRWWVLSVLWDSERPGQSIPERYLPGGS